MIETAAMIDGVGAPLGATQPSARAESTSFAQWFQQELSATNQQLAASDTALQELALGRTDNLHHVMIELEKSKLAFQLTLQVRNKVLEAYQDIMRMQV